MGRLVAILSALAVTAACGTDRNVIDGTSSGQFATDAGARRLDANDPPTCAEAQQLRSYVGCDYWPTVTANGVWSIFDFAVVVANTGVVPAEIDVTGAGGVNKHVTVPPSELRKIFLPWVPSLKGGDMDECTATVPLTRSVLQANGAYHLVSSVPVIVYQFNALQYQGAGGEAGKDWSQCPGKTTGCGMGGPVGCFSFSNDASLLLPSTAMTGNYRVVAHKGWSEVGFGAVNGTTLTITATQAATEVTVALAQSSNVLATSGPGIAATTGGGTITFTLANAGDVAQLVTEAGDAFDFSGSQVQATKPVQVIAGAPCINIPAGMVACDHIEETVLPAETLGKQYVIHPPSGPRGKAAGHVVRLYGNRDGTTLTYQPAKPPACPATLAAGQVADCGIVTDGFEVSGTNEFGVASFMLGAQYLDPTGADRRGDPDATTFASVEQFRNVYVFLTPDDYRTNLVDVSALEGSEVTIDDRPITEPWERIGQTAYGVHRVYLPVGESHVLRARKPVAIQVHGYGDHTSYEFPGGLNLKLIAPPPPPVR